MPAVQPVIKVDPMFWRAVFIFTVFFSLFSQSAEQPRQLWQNKQWLRLGHYKKNLFGNYISQVDDERFFLSKTGKYSPQDELLATIEGMQKPEVQCRYLARREFLLQEMPPTELGFVKADCLEKEAWKKKLNAQGVSVVFATAYLNNAASMFGHTFLKFHSKGNTEDRDLMNYGVNYAAETGADGGVGFAIKGLFGFYNGTFSMAQYHLRLKDYANLEGRDIWEYRLNLTEKEINLLIDHLLELDGINFDYYFFDENCSYELLTILDVVRPDLDLQDQYFYFVIPAETIRLLSKTPGFVLEKKYRPSLRSEFLRKAEILNDQEQKITKQIVLEKKSKEEIQQNLSDIPEARRPLVMNAALDYASIFGYQEPERWSGFLHQLKTVRAPLGADTVTYSQEPVSAPPEFGHKPTRLSFGGGQYGSTNYSLMSVRPAYHDLLSSDVGYLANSQIELLNTQLMLKSSQVRLYDLKLVDIFSSAAWTTFFKPISWRVAAGSRKVMWRESEDLDYYLDVGFGAAWSLDLLATTAFVFVQGYADAVDPRSLFGVGSLLQTVTKLDESFRIKLYWDRRFYLATDHFEVSQLGVRLSHDFLKVLEIRLGADKSNDVMDARGEIVWNFQ